MAALLIAYDARQEDGLTEDQPNEVRKALRLYVTAVAHQELGTSAHVVRTPDLINTVREKPLNCAAGVLGGNLGKATKQTRIFRLS